MGVVRKDWASQNSIALSWSEVEQPPLDIVDYEVKYYEKVFCDSKYDSFIYLFLFIIFDHVYVPYMLIA